MPDDAPRVLSVYPLAAHHAARIKQSGALFRVATNDQQHTLAREIATADAVITRGPARITRAVLLAAPKLKVVAGIGSGTDAIDVRTATERGVTVTSGVGIGKYAVAEWVVGAMLLAHRRIIQAHEAVSSGTLEWSTRFTDHSSNQVTGSSIGIVGLGQIGRQIARLCQAFGMRIRAYDPFSPAPFPDFVERYDDLGEMLALSDTVTVNVPLTEHTRGLLSAKQLACMKKRAVLVNASRGGVVAEPDLIAALTRGDLATAVLDVFEHEPPTQERLAELARVPNLILSPHVAGVTDQAFDRLVSNAVDCVLAVIAGRTPRNIINPGALP
jgi:phosphoglycerate dehydrogenase-like enzyme